MKYCINYFKKDFKYLNEVDEITVRFRASDSSLIDFIELHKNQRINIYIDDEEDFIQNNRIKFFKALAEEHPEYNFVLKLNDIHGERTKEILHLILQEEKLKYFFSTLVQDWDTFWGCLRFQPTDIYLINEMGFQIKDCADTAHALGVQIRVIPNIAQSAWNETNGLMKFFIRPEDVGFYEPYVDVMELFSQDSQLSTYYKIYAKDKKWFGDLNEIIINLDLNLDSRCLLPSFGARRINCNKKCLKGKNCQVCAVTKYLADVLTKNHVTIKDVQPKKVIPFETKEEN